MQVTEKGSVVRDGWVGLCRLPLTNCYHCRLLLLGSAFKVGCHLIWLLLLLLLVVVDVLIILVLLVVVVITALCCYVKTF